MKLALSWIADQRIEAAQQKGAFKNLPGEGRPLYFDDDMSLSWESRLMMRRVLSQQDSALDERRHFLESIQAIRFKKSPSHR